MMKKCLCILSIIVSVSIYARPFDDKLDTLVEKALKEAANSPLLQSRPEKLIVTAATGDHYRTHLAKMIYTCQTTNPDCMIVALLINWDENKIQSFVSNFKPFVFVNIEEPITTPSAPEIRYQVFRMKASIFKHAYFELGAPYVWVDADNVVLKSINPICAKLKNADFCASYVPWKKEEEKFAASVVGFGSSELAGLFVTETCLFALTCDSRSFQEQLGMFHAYNELKSKGLKYRKLSLLENCLFYINGVIVCAQNADAYLKQSGMYDTWKQIEKAIDSE